MLIVADDLHWADKPSLLLLQHLARELGRMRVLLVGTYRDTELSRTHPLSEALAGLNREPGFLRLPLRGLTRYEVAAYIRTTANVEPARVVLDRIFEETEGDPFFLSEVVNLLTQEGTLAHEFIELQKAPRTSFFARAFGDVKVSLSCVCVLDEALIPLADEAFLAATAAAIAETEAEGGLPPFQSLSGTVSQRVCATIDLHFGRLDEADRRFREALAWCERERCPIEAGRCHQGLAEIAERRGDHAGALEHLERAGTLFSQHGAKLFLD